MQEIVGKRIIAVHLGDDGSWIYFTDSENNVYGYKADGDCCAQAYIESVNGEAALIGTVVEVQENSINLSRVYGDDVIDATFYHISTNAGAATIELRISHNGYYGGTLEFREVDEAKGNLIAGTELTRLFLQRGGSS